VNQWRGSFGNSCRDISVDSNGTLAATCQAGTAGWRRTSLSARQCSSYQAGNRDGNLFCESGDGGSPHVNQWRGSFSQTCRDISMDSSGTLTANCQTTNGTWNRSKPLAARVRQQLSGRQPQRHLVLREVISTGASHRTWLGSVDSEAWRPLYDASPPHVVAQPRA